MQDARHRARVLGLEVKYRFQHDCHVVNRGREANTPIVDGLLAGLQQGLRDNQTGRFRDVFAILSVQDRHTQCQCNGATLGKDCELAIAFGSAVKVDRLRRRIHPIGRQHLGDDAAVEDVVRRDVYNRRVVLHAQACHRSAGRDVQLQHPLRVLVRPVWVPLRRAMYNEVGPQLVEDRTRRALVGQVEPAQRRLRSRQAGANYLVRLWIG
mmetsp:Transcript_66201/g.190279  ORF Transcript_66201/g.190279 Transcript_66201/m.190279 type:complete len:210 (+) Transcript_66201:508-1137(+)